MESLPRRKLVRGRPRQPRNAAEAMRLAAWAALQVSKGKLTPDDAKAITVLLREFREFLQLDLLVKARERHQQQPPTV
jgi:hypothetical protein